MYTLSSRIDNMQLDCRNKRKNTKLQKSGCSNATPSKRMNKGRLFLVFATLAMEVNIINAYENNMTFDTDLGTIGIDNQCTVCISHDNENFEGKLVNLNIFIMEFGVQYPQMSKRTMKWKRLARQ